MSLPVLLLSVVATESIGWLRIPEIINVEGVLVAILHV